MSVGALYPFFMSPAFDTKSSHHGLVKDSTCVIAG